MAHAAASGTLADFYYYTVVYNRDVHLKPTEKHLEWLPIFFFRLTGQTGFFVVFTFLVGRAVPFIAGRFRAVRRTGSGWARSGCPTSGAR